MIDYHHSNWAEIVDRLNKRLESLKNELSNPQDETKTADLRGRIAEVHVILNWPSSDTPNQPIEETTF